MSQLIQSLRRRNEAMQKECDMLAEAIDEMAEKQSVILNRLLAFDPVFVRQIANQPEPQQVIEAVPDTAAAQPSTDLATLQ